MVGDASIQLVTRGRWVDLVSCGPIRAPQEILAVPGIRLVEPEAGLPDPIWKVEIPSTTWMLPGVRDVFSQFSFTPQVSNVLVPPWPGLYKYQQDAVQWLVEKQGGLLALSLGLGKSRTAAVAARVIAARTQDPVLIVALKYLRETWRREIQQVFGNEGYVFEALEGVTPRILQRPDLPLFLFCHYDIVHAWWSQITALHPRVVILDEAHLIKNAKTRRGKAAHVAATSATCRIALTGTPILNKPKEAFSILELVSGRYSWGSQGNFRVRYCGAYTDLHGLVDGEPSNVEELRERLSSCVLRKTPEDVGLELPPVTRQLIYVDLEPRFQEQYHQALGGHDTRDVLEAILGGRASTRTIEWLGRLRAIASNAKLAVTKELVDALEEPAVVFCWRRETVDTLCLGKGLRWRVHGGLTHDSRTSILAAFDKAGGTLSATYDSLATGVTLSRARVVIMHDLDWVPANLLQAEGRVTGGLRRVAKHCISKWLVARGTLDELMIRLLGMKGGMIETTLADRSAKQLADFLGYSPERASFDKLIAWARSV